MSQVRILPLQPIPPFNGQTTSGKPDGRGFARLRTLPSGTSFLLREGYPFPFCAPAVTPFLPAPAAFFFWFISMWTSFDVLDSATLKASRDKFTGRLSEKIPLIFEDDFVRPDDTETIRPTSQEERRDLKATVARLLRQVGASNVAKESRVGEAHLSRYASPREKEFMPLDVLADVERMAGYPLVTEYMAQLSGFSLVQNESEADTPDMEDVSRLADTKGRLLSALITSFLDGKIDNHERRTLLPLLDDAIAQMQELRSGLIGGGA